VISYRYVPALCALILLPLVPTWIHSYSGLVRADGLTTAAVPDTLGAYRGSPSGRNATWGQRRFESDDWMERIYRQGPNEVRLTVVRSFDLKTLYHHPELAVAYGPSFARETIDRLPDRPDMPIHVLRPAVDGDATAMYVLLYGGRFVANPIAFQIQTAGELLVSGRQPMTLFFTTETNVPDGTAVKDLASAEVLSRAIDAFVAPAR
jgi:hypothetical protein